IYTNINNNMSYLGNNRLGGANVANGNTSMTSTPPATTTTTTGLSSSPGTSLTPNLLFSNNNALNTNNISWLLTSQSGGDASARTKEKEKAKKKLAQFLDVSIDATKRFKGLSSFINNSDDQEIDKVFKENSQNIYQTFVSTFSTYELGTYKLGKHHSAEKEVMKLNDLLKRILIHLEAMIKKGWQVKSIVNILEKMLGVENIHSIRQSAFSTLLFFLEVMEKPDRHKLDLFAAIIDFTPYSSDYTYRLTFSKKVFTGQDSAKRYILVQSTDPPTREESSSLFEQIFIHISSRLNNFPFWFEVLKSQYLVVLYPTVFKKIGLLPAGDNSGFGSHCPHDLQVTIINYLSSWVASNSSVKEFLLNNNSGANNFAISACDQPAPTPAPGASQFLTNTPGTGKIAILLEIFKQSCRLPLKYFEVIKKSIYIFQTIFLNSSPDLFHVFGEELFTYQTFILTEMTSVFETDAAGHEKEREIIGMFVIGTLKQLIDEYPNLRPKSREILLNAMIKATFSLLRKSNTNKASMSLEQTILSTTLYAWIKSKENNPDMWLKFAQQFEELYHRAEVIKQIKTKIIQMTTILKGYVYPLSEKKQQKLEKDIKNAEKGGAPKSFDSRDPLVEVQIESNIAQLKWDKESCMTTWTFLLSMFKNVHNIKETTTHELSMGIFSDIIDIILEAEEQVEFTTTKDNNWRPISLLNIFGPHLFDAYRLDNKYVNSKVLALNSLCRLICRHHPQYPTTVLVSFYELVKKVLLTPEVISPAGVNHVDLSWTVIPQCSNIFNLAIPGVNILVSPFLYRIRAILVGDEYDMPPKDVRKKCLVIIASLLFYPYHFPSLILTGARDQNGKAISKDLTMKELKKELIDLLIYSLKNEKSVENRIICLWSLSTLAMEEFNSSPDATSSFNQSVVNELIECISSFTLHQDQSLSKTALDALSNLSAIFPRLTKPTVLLMLNTVCGATIKAMNDYEAGNSAVSEQTVANHFYCLLDWACQDSCIFDDQVFAELRTKLFQAIETGLGQRGESWNSGVDSLDPLKRMSKSLARNKSTALSKPINGKLKDSVQLDDDILESFGANQPKPSLIKDAAETLLFNCMNFVHHFPSKEGPEVFSSLVDEADDLQAAVPEDETPLFSVLHENALISIVEVPKPNGQQGTLARLFIRDATGKYVWNFDHVYNLTPGSEAGTDTSPNSSPPLSLVKMYANSQPVIIDNTSYQYENKLPVKPPKPEPPKDEKLKGLLLELSKQPECLPTSGVALDRPLGSMRQTLIQEFTRIQGEVESFVKQEIDYQNKKYEESTNESADWVCRPPVKTAGVASQARRLLMSYLGLLNISNSSYLKQLDSNIKFVRALQQLDITPSRDIQKIGLIYVAEGQDEQRDILHNSTSSSLYAEFVNGLGWPIDLQTHRGYLGGLDRQKTTGTTAPYFANMAVETIFHNITMMPTNKAEPQQIHKKRHVGNDIVNIIWSEHIRDYCPTTITSQFNDAHIVIYPLPNGLFRVQIYRKESKVPMFGPLVHGMAVNKQLLSTLVRQTAINAYKQIRYNTPNYTRPYAMRKMRIKEIVDRYRSDKSYVDYVHSAVSGHNIVSTPANTPPMAAVPTANGAGVGNAFLHE
ncbi:hypothetical protein SAMD00019534_119900, partial [Acytostelium subglobosum LB1]|uniref:hypothetical protein n=1 Tax=Acytostelium subglobosum LB1 TaxID=1410327 RepID=UPI0006450A84